MRINSLLFCRQQLASLASLVDRRWCALRRATDAAAAADYQIGLLGADDDATAGDEGDEGGGGGGGVGGGGGGGGGGDGIAPPRTVLHQEADGAVAAALDEVIAYVGAHLIFRTHHQQLLGDLYTRRAPRGGAGAGAGALTPMLHERLPPLDDPPAASASAAAAPSAFASPSAGGGGGALGLRRGGRAAPPYLARVLDESLILIGQTILPRGAHDALILSTMTALSAALVGILLQGEPKRHLAAADGDALRRDVALLREYFVARDEFGEALGLPAALVEAETSYLDGLVALMAEPTEALLSREREEDPDWDAARPRNKLNVARLMVGRMQLDGQARRFVEQNREALRGIMSKAKNGAVATRHGEGVGRLRAEREGGRAAYAAADDDETVADDEPPSAPASSSAARGGGSGGGGGGGFSPPSGGSSGGASGGTRARAMSLFARVSGLSTKSPPTFAGGKRSTLGGAAAAGAARLQ